MLMFIQGVLLDFLRHGLVSVPPQGKESDGIHSATGEKGKKQTTVDKYGDMYKQIQRMGDWVKNHECIFQHSLLFMILKYCSTMEKKID